MHSVLDIPTEGIRNAITYKFCFKSENDKEIDRMISLLALENTPEMHDKFKALQSGQCIFQDLDGNSGILQFDAVFQDVIDTFKTTPKTEKEEEKELETKQEEKTTENIVKVEVENADKEEEAEIDIYEREVV